MKLQLIMLETPIIVSDEEIKEGELYVNNGKFFHADAKFDKGNNPNNSNPRVTDHNFKIIAGISELPSIDFSSLSAEDCSKIGLVGLADVESFIDEFEFASIFKELPEGKSAEPNPRDTVSKNSLRKEAFKYYSIGVRETLKKVQQLNEKKFSLEDMKNIFKKGIKWGDANCELGGKHSEVWSYQQHFNREIKLLQQPKIFDIEVEMGQILVCKNQFDGNSVKRGWTNTGKFQPKITNNQIKITKIL